MDPLNWILIRNIIRDMTGKGRTFKTPLDLDIMIAGYLISEKELNSAFTIQAIVNLLKGYGIPCTAETVKRAFYSLIRRGLIESHWGEKDEETGKKLFNISIYGLDALMSFKDDCLRYRYIKF